jgi:glycerol-3-phosphate dehydrogenase
MLTKTMLLSVMLLCAGISWSLPIPQAITNKTELAAALKNARTPEDHRRLAAYYQEQARQFLDKTKKEQDLADYYSKHAINYPAKYPTRYQSAKHLADYYQWQSNQVLAKADAQLKQAIGPEEANPKSQN